jgi:pSer/pThr/pTyr-binding forkhead associated (FHA) protein
MQLSLLVLTPGKWEGKSVPVTVSPFLIGRDAKCHLRPASPAISNRHCDLFVRDGQLFVRDQGSTNGTFVNDQRLEGEQELHDGDRLQLGPLKFGVRLAGIPAATPAPAAPKPPDADEDTAADMLLGKESGGPAPNDDAVDSLGVPTGDTVMMAAPPKPEGDQPNDPGKLSGDTAEAAQEIYKKYGKGLRLRKIRPRR